MFISKRIVIIPMKSKEILKQTSAEQHNKYLVPLVAFLISGVLTGLVIGIVVAPLAGILLGVVVGLVGSLLFEPFVQPRLDKRNQRVNLFMGYHDWDKFVELSLKYLGYETKILDKNDKQLIILNDKHMVYASKHVLSLGDIDKVCKTAKDNNKSLTVITKHEGVTSDASVVAKRAGIIIHDYNGLYDVLDKTIKTKGGDPIRECLCT